MCLIWVMFKSTTIERNPVKQPTCRYISERGGGLLQKIIIIDEITIGKLW